MKNVLLYLLIITSTFCLQAQTKYTYKGTGNWTDQANWSPSYPGSTIKAGDEVTISSGSNVTVISLTNNGTFINKGYFENHSSFNNYGTIQNDSVIVSLSFFSNYGTINNDSIFRSNSFFSNYGTLVNNLKFYCNSFFENNSILIDNGIFYHNSFFYGKNKIHQNDFKLNSIFSAGTSDNLSVGKYIFNNNLNITGAGYVTCDIRSDNEYDTIVVSGQATLSGNLNVQLLTGYEPAIGTSYVVLTASKINGTFSNTTFPKLSGNKTFEIKYTNKAVILNIVSNPLGLGDHNIEESSPTKIIKAYNLQGQEIIDLANFEGIAILMYSDGTRKKVLK